MEDGPTSNKFFWCGSSTVRNDWTISMITLEIAEDVPTQHSQVYIYDGESVHICPLFCPAEQLRTI